MCSRGERDLGRAGEEEAVLLELVDVRLLGREEAGADHRLLAHEHRRQHRREPGRGDVIEREAVEREREQRRVADDVAEPRARRAAQRARARSARSRSPPSPPPSAAGSPKRRISTASSSVSPSGAESCGGFGTSASASSRAASAAASSSSAARSSSFTPLQLLELLRRRLALQLRRGCGDRRRAARAARQRSSAASSASNASPAPLRASAARQASGSARAALRSIMRAILGRRRSRWRHPPRSALGQIQSARSRSSGFASSTAIPKPASSISSMSFSPSPNETMRSSEMPSCSRHERDARSLRHRRVAELEEVGEGGRQEEPVAERLRRAPRAAPGCRPGRRPRRASSAALVSQAARSPTSSTGRCWKPAYIREYSVCSADVEAVVDVTVRRVPERGEQRDRLARGLERDRLVEHERAARPGRRRRRPGNRRRGRRCPPPRGRAGPSGTSVPWPRSPGSRPPGSG